MCRQIIASPFANRSYQSRPKATAARRHNLVTLTRPNRKLSQPRRINVSPLPEATQWNWLANLKAKEVAGTTTSQAPTPSHPVNTPTMQSPTSPIPLEHIKYCIICTPLGKICPNEFPMSSD